MALLDPLGHDGKTYDGKEFRYSVALATHGRAGVGALTHYAATPQGSPNNTVQVAAGVAAIPATGAGLLGSYAEANDAALTSPTFAATGAQGRWDLLILQVTAGVAALVVVQGTASGSPSYPSLAGQDNYIVICGVKFPANKSIIDNGANGVIEDRRSLWASHVVCTSSTRPAIPFDGQRIYETDTDLARSYNGTAWVRDDVPIVCTSGARPSGTELHEGLVIYETDTDKILTYDGSAWTLPKNVAGGVLGIGEWTANALVANSSGEFSTGLTVTCTTGAGRRIKVSIAGRGIQGGVANDQYDIYVKEDGTEMMRTTAQIVTANGTEPLANVRHRTPSGASHTWTVYATRTAGTGTGGFIASAVNPTTLLIEDVGGV